MTLERAESLLTVDQLESARAAGSAWGEQEVECWRDQHDGAMDRAQEWTLGNWCGENPLGNPADSEVADAYDLVVDFAAREVWEAARD